MNDILVAATQEIFDVQWPVETSDTAIRYAQKQHHMRSKDMMGCGSSLQCTIYVKLQPYLDCNDTYRQSRIAFMDIETAEIHQGLV